MRQYFIDNLKLMDNVKSRLDFSKEQEFRKKLQTFLFQRNDLLVQIQHLCDIQVPGRCQHGGDDVFDRDIPDAMMRERAKQ